MTVKKIDYNRLDQRLKTEEIGLTAAELHGFLTGLLAGGNSDESWLPLLEDLMHDKQPIKGALAEQIRALYQLTQQQIGSEQFEFQLLLPEGELFSRIDHMIEWVNHFLLGLGLAHPQLNKVKGDVGEAIHDLRQITQLGYDEEEDQEELAFAFEEIMEYIRVTVILCFDEFSQTVAKPTLH